MRFTKLFIAMTVTLAAGVASADPACNMQKAAPRFGSTNPIKLIQSNGLPVLTTTTGTVNSGNQ